MDKKHILNLHLGKTISCLEGILAPNELAKIEDAIRDNTRRLIRLAEDHLRFANNAAGRSSWRQRVSRAYYACYISSRAIRLAVNREYNQDPSDHKNIGHLPDDFPNRSIWENLLTKFKADRNLADYDHSTTERQLELPSREYLAKAVEFLHTAKDYLRTKGH